MPKRLWLLRQRPRQTLRSNPLRSEGAPRRAVTRESLWFCAAILCLQRLMFGALLIAATAASAAHFPDNTPPRGDLASLLINVSRYATWPKSVAAKPLTVCIAHGGSDALIDTNSSHEWTVKGVPVSWMHISSPLQVGACSVVWLNADVRPAPRAWIAAVVDQPVLTVSNYADFTADGGIIGAYRVGPDWRFEINLEALQRSKINIAAVALRLSQRPQAAAGGAKP
jgi:YfiR/HmsC-like